MTYQAPAIGSHAHPNGNEWLSFGPHLPVSATPPAGQMAYRVEQK